MLPSKEETNVVIPPSVPRKSTRRGSTLQSKTRALITIALSIVFATLYLCCFARDRLSYVREHFDVKVELQHLLLSWTHTIEQRAEKILTDNPLIDGHNDFLSVVKDFYKDDITSEKFKHDFENGSMFGHVDLPRLKQGKSAGAFWSLWRGCPANVTDFSDGNYEGVVNATYGILDLAHRLELQYSDVFTLTANSTAATQAFKTGRYISPVAIEGLHQIGNSVKNLRRYFRMGVRYATLTHNCHNKYADAALIEFNRTVVKSTPLWHGVSQEGIELIKEMNTMGMIVDLSHVSRDTMIDVLNGSIAKDWAGALAPPIFSHSSAYAICPHPRNVEDDVLQLVKKRNSIVMVNFAPDFISCTPSHSSTGVPDFFPANSTVTQVVRHIKHIGDLIGYDHVGVGSDFDGIPTTPRGLEDVSKFPALVTEMLGQGITDRDAAKVVGWNLLRVWAEVDRVAHELQKLDDYGSSNRSDQIIDQ